MTTILAALTVTVIFAIVVLLAVLRAGICQQEHAGSLTRRPRKLSAAIARRVFGLHACLPRTSRRPSGRSGQEGRVMAFRKVSYLIASCDGCGLAWSFADPACEDGIPPHFASKAAARAQLSADYGWQVTWLSVGPGLMVCRRCAAAGVIPVTAGRAWLLLAAGWIRRLVPFGPDPPPAPARPRTWPPGVDDRCLARRAGRPADGAGHRDLPGPAMNPRQPGTRTAASASTA